ncbi:hypothetical protein [Azospirillum brasilense]|uniref:hypothetical protein n=1 Tax=Azospirillum brasilense TaxID=192 RepID=UPI001EDC8873|nr:hypothetical protein [Azospirillum brasilense]UKJ74441.1 phage tail protein [Azospirillum brasilense]
MKTFALITEGITDQAFLQVILEAYYGDDEEIDVTPLEPPRDATDESRQAEGGHGGWENVLEQCSIKEVVSDAISLNDYLIIQVDTDVCEEVNFNVSYRYDGRERTTHELIEAVKEKLVSKIDPEVYEKNKDKFIFAIAVHSLECWLLTAHGHTKSAKEKLVECEDQLRRSLGSKKIKYVKNYYSYISFSKEYRRKKDLMRYVEANISFKIFVESLPKN